MAEFPTYEEMAKNVAEKALDDFLYNGKSIREWMQIIASEDCISRKAVLNFIEAYCNNLSNEIGMHIRTNEMLDTIRQLPSATPQPKTESGIHCNCTDAEIIKSFIEDVEAVKELLPQAESEDKK